MENKYMEIAVDIPGVTLEDLYSLFVHDEPIKLHRLTFLYSLLLSMFSLS